MLTMILNSMEGPLQLILARPSPQPQVCARTRNTQPGVSVLSAPIAGLTHIDSLCWEPGGQGAETLIPNLDSLLRKNSFTPENISRIACVRGPGSFTGIRLALSTALGLSRSIPGSPELAGLDYLPLLAAAAREQHNLPRTGSIWTLTHARRGQTHIQGFNLEEALTPLCEPKACLLDQACAIIAEISPPNTPAYLSGSGFSRNREAFSLALPDAVPLDEPLYPSLESLLEAAGRAAYSQKPIEPLYLRASDAEENLPYIAAGLGLDPHQAMLDLLKLTGRDI